MPLRGHEHFIGMTAFFNDETGEYKFFSDRGVREFGESILRNLNK